MNIVCLDMEGVLVPEIWIAFAEEAGIPELKRTTRDEPDYDKLMNYRPTNPQQPARTPKKFAPASPLSLCFRFPSTNRRPKNQQQPARTPIKFALASPLSHCFPFSGANRRPKNQQQPAQTPIKFALASPQSHCSPFPGANRRPENQQQPARETRAGCKRKPRRE